MSVRVLITGITGFAGSHLAECLLKRPDVEVHGTQRWRSNTQNIDPFKARIALHGCDIRDASSVRDVLDRIRPDRIFHLAAQSFVPMSWSAPTESLSTNLIGQLNLLEGIRQIGINPLLQIAGSSEEYGLVNPEELPIRESNPLRPLSPYAVSKVGQDLLGFQYFMSYELNIVRTRGFNHTGPRRGDVFVESNLSQQIARIEAGLQEPVLTVGNLDTQRDFTDVRDMVEGYWLALEKGTPGEVYNICTGHALSIRQILEMLLSMSSVRVRVVEDPARLRPSDPSILLGDHSKFSQATGWQSRIPMERTLQDLLDYWRQKIATPTREPLLT